MASKKDVKVTPEEMEAKEAAKAAEETAKTEESAEQTTEETAKEEAEEVSKEDSTAEEKADASEENKTEKKLFGKGNKKEVEKLKAQVDELNDKVVRQMAEFDNYRKRTEKEKQSMFETGAKSVIEKILPVVDNFERGLATIPEGEAKSSFAEGMNMIYKQLMSELEKIEVKPIEAVGKEFDPNLHSAVMHVDDESLGENIVAEELQKGYTYRETVVRYSMVKVAN